eukprot:4673113-Alexandrium_andersonii.AAC.1
MTEDPASYSNTCPRPVEQVLDRQFQDLLYDAQFAGALVEPCPIERLRQCRRALPVFRSRLSGAEA